MKAALVVVALVVALAGCGPAEEKADTGVNQQEVENIVNDLDGVVGSAESEIAES